MNFDQVKRNTRYNDVRVKNFILWGMILSKVYLIKRDEDAASFVTSYRSSSKGEYAMPRIHIEQTGEVS